MTQTIKLTAPDDSDTGFLSEEEGQHPSRFRREDDRDNVDEDLCDE